MMFRSLQVPNYRIWVAGAFVSNIGTWMQRIAQDWLVLTELTDGDVTALGLSMALQFAPLLLLVPLTGVIADRVNRRRLLVGTQVAMALVAATLAAITLLGVVELWMVFLCSLALGIASAFDNPARQSFVSELVPPKYLGNAVGLNSTSFNGARLVGPAVAGLLVAAVGTGWVFLINVGTFAIMLAAILALRSADFVKFSRSPRGQAGLREGVRYVRKRPDLLLIFAMVFIVGTFGLNFGVFIAAMSRLEFGLDAAEYGLLSSVLAVGSVAGALLSARRERPRLRTLTLASTGLGLSLIVGAVMPSPAAFAVCLAMIGFTALTALTTAIAYVQTTTTPAMRGRVMALYVAILLGGIPIGAPILGWIADTLGPRWAMGAGALSGFIAAGVALVFYARTRHLRMRWQPERRWPLRFQTGRSAIDRELATTEIAIVQAESQRP